MLQFEYRAVDASGSIVAGRLHAAHLQDLMAQLGRMGLTLVPEIALEAECRNRNLTVVPFGDPAPSRSITLFFSSRTADEADQATLASIVRQAARTKNPAV